MANQEEQDFSAFAGTYLLSVNVIAFDESHSAIPTPTQADNLIAADLVYVDDEDDDDNGVIRVLDDYVHDKDEYDQVDDELVPISVCKKLPRDRIRKSGKRSFVRLIRKSEKTPWYLQMRRGCIHGKHGFGINFT